MMNYYDSLGRGRYTRLKKGIGDVGGSPPTSRFSAMRTWLVMFFVLISSVLSQEINAQSIANYAFTFSNTGSLEDLSSGSTSIMTGNNDTAATTVQPIGFDFYFMGVKYTHFSANSNGQVRLHTSSGASAIGSGSITGYSAGVITLAAMAGDNEVNNGMRMKVIGSSPNRKLVIEWNQFYANWFPDLTNAGNMQMWLNETTGRIDYVYGEIYNSSSSSVSKAIFVSSGNTATASGHVLVGATPTFTAGTSPSTNTFAAGSGVAVGAPVIANLGSSANGSRWVYSFTPMSTATPADPTTLTYTAVTTTTTTPNWVDNSTDETFFIVTRATDAAFTQNVVTSTVASTTTAGTGTSYNSPQTGLTPGTLYYYKIQAASEGGAPGAGLTGSQVTTSGTTYYWVGASGGVWATAANWNTAADGTGTGRGSVQTTDVLIVDGASTTPGGSLTINVDAASFSIGQFKVTNNTALTMQSSATATRTITITGGGGDDFVVESGSTLTLNHASQAVAFAFSGTGNVGTIAGTYNASGSTSNVITTTGGTGTLVTVTGSVNNSIVGSSGCMAGSTATLNFANGSNYTHSAFTTSNGYIPSATWGASSNVFITGGTTSTGITNPTQTFGNFTYNGTTSTGTMSVWTSGTTAVIQGDLTIQATGTGIFRATTSGTVTVNGNVIINGGNVQVGSSSGNMVVLGNTTIAAAGTLNINSGTYSQRGTTFTNNGALTGTSTSCNLNFFSPTNVAQTFAGTGTVTTNIGALGVQNTSGLTITHTNQIPVLRANLFNGTITNSNKITMGTGAALAVVGQMGYAGNTFAGGSFDVSPTWNLGTGTYTFFYAQESGLRTTGFEVSPARTFTTVTYSSTNGLTLAGGNIGIGTLNMSANAGNINTNAGNILTITGTATNSLARTLPTGYINGPLALTLPASLASGSTYTFPVGKGTLNSFALVNPTTTSGGTVVVQAEVFDANSGGTPGTLMGSLNTNRYWTASITSGAGNFTNSNIQLTDTPGTADGIAASATQGGAYDLIGGTTSTVTGTSITTGTPVTSLPGFFVMGAKASATLSNLAISPTGNQCTNVARTVTVTVTPGGAATTGVVINYSVNGVAQTPVAMTNTSGDDWSGTIPTVTPANASVTWSVTATDANSLTKSLTGTGYQDEPLFGASATASATSSTICDGSSTTLSVQLNSAGSAPIGAGATTISGTTTGFGNPYNHWYGGMKTQYIYTKAELNAAGFSGGNLNSLAYEITALGSPALTMADFTINIGHTSQSVATTTLITSGLTQVYSSASQAVTSGINTYNFSTPFNWNNTDNIVISISWSNVNSGNSGSSATVKGDNTATAQTTILYADNTTASAFFNASTNTSPIGTTNNLATSTQRPRIVLSGNVAGTPSGISWSDGSTTVGTGNNLSVSPTTNTTYTATVTASGCTVTSNSVAVTVNPAPTAPTGTGSSQCGNQVPTASVADTNGFTTPAFNWYAASTGGSPLQSSTTTTYTTAIAATTTFHVAVVNPSTGCESARTPVTVTVSTPDAVSASASAASICLGESVDLTAANTASSPTQNYTYEWTSTTGSGAVSPVSGSPATVTPTAAGTYTYTVTATDGGCIATNTVNVTVAPLPQIFVNPTTSTVCEGTPVNLGAVIGGVGTATVGTDTTLTIANGIEPTAFNNRYEQYWMQMVYTPAELTAAGLAPGPITSIAFNITTLGDSASNPLYEVRMGAAASPTVTAFQTTGLTQVFGPVTYNHAVGVNTINFTTPYNWDGTSNLIIDVRHEGVDTTNNARTYYTATTGNTVVSAVTSTSSSTDTLQTLVSNGSATPNLSNKRLNVVFGGLVGTTSGYTFSWMPGSLSGANQTVTPSATTTYTVTATNTTTGCSNTQTATVNVNPKPTAPVGTDSSQCGAGTPTASVSDPNGFPAGRLFKWYAAASGGSPLQTDTSSTYLASVAATTTFHVSVTNPTTGCESDRTPVTVTFVAADTIAIAPSTTTPCEDTQFSLSASSVNAGYVYTWTASPVAGSGIPTSVTGASVDITPTAGGTYVYTVSGTDGNCTNTNTVTITVVAPTVNASASPATICAGGSTTLTATTPTVSTGTAAVGAGASTEFDRSPYRGGANANKVQYLFTAAELTAAGIYPGNLTSMTFTTTGTGSALTNFQIAIGHTSATSLGTTFNTDPATVVFGPTSHTPTSGDNTHTFTTPFNWNGTSNIIITVCHEAGASSTASVRADSNTGKTTGNVTFVAGSICASSTAVTGTLRPAITFGAQVVTQGVGSLVYTWNPGGLSGNVQTVSPATTTTYTVSAFDSSTGCTATKDVVVTVNPLPIPPVGTDSAQCGPGVPTASVADANGFASPTFKWYADNVTTTALQSSVSTTYTTSISATTTFYVSIVNPTTGCESTRTPVTVTYTEPDAIVRNPGATVTGCSNQPLAMSVSSANGAYVYTWTASPAAGSGIATSVTGAAPSITPTAPGTYVYTINALGGGCNTSTTITATVSLTPSAISINQTGSQCVGFVKTLTANGGTAPSTATVGTDTTLTTANGLEPTAFNNRYEQFWMQTVYTAADLTSAGVTAGPINSIAFNITTLGDSASNPLYEVRIGTTANSVLTAFQTTGLTLVYGPVTYTHAIGVNTINFSTPYNWDGVSNIIVDIRHEGVDTTNNAQTYYTATAGNTVILAVTSTPSSTSTVQALVAAGTVSPAVQNSNKRLNTTFGYTANVSLVWSPTTNLYSDAAGTTPYAGQSTSVVYANPTTSTTYTATATLGACSTSEEITVEPTPLPEFTLEDATICKGGSTVLTADGPGNSFSWSPGTGLSATSGSSVTANPLTTTTYTVTATNNTTGCQNSHMVTVTVNDPVTLTGPGISPLSPTAITGQTVTFTASATGSGLTYQWYVNDGGGFDPIPGANDTTLDVVVTGPEMGGYLYHVVVSGLAPCPSETSADATLNFDTTGITDQPDNAVVCAPNGTTFTVVATSEDMAPEEISYGWEVSTDNGATWTPIVDGLDNTIVGYEFENSDTATLSLVGTNASMAAADDWIFHAVVNGLIFSDNATLTVNAPVELNASPSNQTVCAGAGVATFTVGVGAGDVSGYQWQVSTDGGGSWTNVVNAAGSIAGATTATLTLTNMPASANGYQYQVIVNGVAPCGSATSGTATLNVTNIVVSSQPANAIVVIPQTATFTVATAAPSPTYQWKYSTTLGGTYTNVVNGTPAGVTYSGDTSATLSVTTSATTPVSANYYYKAEVTSQGCSVLSTGAQMDVRNYCVPTYSAGPGTVDIIANVTLGTLSNTTTGSTVAPYYTFYNNVTVPDITQLSNAVVSVTFGADTANFSGVWIDFNRNGIFEASEGVVASAATAGTATSGGTTTYTIPVPLTAVVGQTRMRVRGGDDVALTTAQACGASGDVDGETEDYIVNIVAAPACSGTPVAGTVSGTPANLCISGTSTLTVSGYTTGVTGISFQWYDGATNLPIATATGTSYTTPTLTASHTYFVRVTCTDSGLFADASYTVNVANPLITGTTPNSRCGVGTVSLAATSSAGTTVQWYDVATGGSPVGQGNSFVTPVIGATTTYYAAAVSPAPGTAPVGTDTTLTVANGIEPTAFNNRYEQYWMQMVYTPAELNAAGIYPGPITSIAFNITTLGDSASNPLYEVRMGAAPAATVTAFQTTGLTQVFGPVTYTHAVGVNTINFTTPYNWDGTSNLIIDVRHEGVDTTNNARTYYTATTGNTVVSAVTSTSSSTNTLQTLVSNGSATPNLSNKRLNVTFGAQVGCASARTAVQATVNPAPALTLSGSSATICSGDTTGTVTITSTVADFDSYSWSPSTGVSGSAASGYTFNPTETTTYTLTGSNSVSGCANAATYTVNVTPLPVITAATASPEALCQGLVSTLTATTPAAIYSVSGSTGTYTPISGTAVSGAVGDDVGVGNLPIGFNFSYNGTNYSVFGVDSNGHITLGSTSTYTNATGAGWNEYNNDLLNTRANLIAPFWDDNNTTGGTVQYTTTGTVGNKILTVQWTNMHVGGTGSTTTPTLSMQVKLYEATGNIEFRYGPTSGTLSSPTATVGISGAVGSFLSVTPATPASASTASATVNNNGVTGTNIPNGTILTLTPPPVAQLTWSPTTGLFTDAAATNAYTGGAAPTVYASPSSTTTYVATLFSPTTGCSSTANVTVTVNPMATVVAPATMDLCAATVTTQVPLVGSPGDVVFDITGGASVGLSNQTGVTSIPAFTAIQGTATVTVTPRTVSCTGTPVTFTIKVSPATVGGSVTGGTTICGGSTSGVLTLSGHTGNVTRWESSVSPFSVWTPIANTATTYTSGPLTQTTQFRAVVQSGACVEEASAPTTVTVNAVTLSSVTSAQVCLNTMATVTLNGMAPNSTSTVAYNKSGVPQTPVTVVADASGVGTFEVLVTAAGQNVVVTSITRTDVTPNCPFTPSTGNSVTFVISTQCSAVQTCGITLAAIDTQVIANIVSNVQGYRWRVTTLTGPNTNLVQTLDTSLRTMKLTQLATYAFATQYQIEVATLRAGVWGPFSSTCTVTTPSPTTSLTPCGQTLTTISDVIYANLVPYAAGYRFRITDPLNGANTQVIDRSVRDIRMNLVTAFMVQYGKTYNIEVAVKNTDGTYLSYGSVCSVTTPVFPTTSLQDSQCDDYAVPSNSTSIYAFSYPGAVAYAFQLTGPGLPVEGVEVVKSTRTFTLSDFTGLVPGATYNVKVRLIFNLADPAGPYGKTCTIITPGASRIVETAVKFNAVAFPNPFAETFDINVTTSLDQNINVKVYDMTGRLLETRDVKVTEIESLHVGDRYPSGVYNVIVSQGENVKTLRVIKR